MLRLHQLIRNEFNDPFLKSGRLAIVLSSKVSVLLCQVRLVFLASSQVSLCCAKSGYSKLCQVRLVTVVYVLSSQVISARLVFVVSSHVSLYFAKYC